MTRRRLREFWERDKRAEPPLDEWFRRMKKLKVSNLAQLRKTFPSADLVGKCTVFNLGGNKYRLITKINFPSQIVFVRNILTHKEYDQGKWKADC